MKTHWKKLTNPDYIGAYDFQPGEERTLTIQSVLREMITGPDGKKDECTVVKFTDGKPMICNNTNAKVITKVVGSPHIEDWIGQRITLIVQRVKAFGDVVDAIRIKPVKPGKPVLDPSGPSFDKAAEFVRGGGDIEKIRAKYEVSQEVLNQLNNVAK